MSFKPRNAIGLALIVAATASMAACSRPRPDPEFDIAPPNNPPQQGPTQPGGPLPPSRGQPLPPPISSSAIPGSIQDFVINVGDRVYFDFDQY